MKRDSLYIIIPAYNEESNINQVIEEWYPIVERYNGDGHSRLVVIDDGSKDNTYSLLKEAARERPMLEVITKENSGHGATVLYGYQYALDSGADFVFQTDSDGQTVSQEFHQFWEYRNDYDIVIGWRKSRKDGFSRVVVAKTLKAVINLCFKVRVKDANTPFRIMNSSNLKTLIQHVPKDFNLSNVILTVVYEKCGCKIKYIPITFKPRQGGENSINLRKIIKLGKKAITDFRDISKNLKNL